DFIIHYLWSLHKIWDGLGVYTIFLIAPLKCQLLAFTLCHSHFLWLFIQRFLSFFNFFINAMISEKPSLPIVHSLQRVPASARLSVSTCFPKAVFSE
ncbi:MAG: hypothetical protein ACI4JY_05685, partial [Oscillospiraceae bacterium]